MFEQFAGKWGRLDLGGVAGQRRRRWVNECHFGASEGDAVLKTLALAARELDEAGYAAWLRENSRKASRDQS
jgi:hypothetical protein